MSTAFNTPNTPQTSSTPNALNTPVSVGHYLITPLSRVTDQGDYAASVSLRRGSYDRVYRFFPRFANAEGALSFALAQARALLTQDQRAWA